MKHQIAIIGSHSERLDKKLYKISSEIGSMIAKKGYILLTGGCTGIAESAAQGAKESGGIVIGFSPESHRTSFNKDLKYKNHDIIIFSGMGYKGRNLLMIRSCDAVIVINGGMGTLDEVTIAEGEEKHIVVIEGTGGCADKLKKIFQDLNPGYKKVCYVCNAKSALNKIGKIIKNEPKI
ncbi:MAG: TIGR00725 family protein [Candidatus Nanoarchaeia archaeon]|nr:TIGR00725 family protein [Candidatus Nanoarchaeia archaeon]